MRGWFWISSQFTHLGYLSTVPLIIFIFCHLHHLIIFQGPPLLWKGDGQRRGWLPEEDSFLSVPRAFLDTELKRSRQSRPASGRRSSSGKAEPRTVFPCCGGAEKGEDIRPPTHTLPLRAQEHSLPTAGLGELVSELSFIFSTHPAASGILTRVPHHPGWKDQRVGVTNGDPAAGWA